MLIRELTDCVRQTHLFERRATEAEPAEHHRDRPALLEHVRAEATDLLEGVREVDLTVLVERLPAVGGDDALGDRGRLDRRDRVPVHAPQPIRQSDHRRGADLDVQVRPLAFHEILEPAVELRYRGIRVLHCATPHLEWKR